MKHCNYQQHEHQRRFTYTYVDDIVDDEGSRVAPSLPTNQPATYTTKVKAGIVLAEVFRGRISFLGKNSERQTHNE